MSMKRPVVGIDADGILVDTYPPWLEAWNRIASRQVTIHDWVQYDGHTCLGAAGGALTSEEKRAFYEIITKDQSFWANLQPLPGALEAAQELEDVGCDVIVVTAPSGPHSAAGKLESLAKLLPWLSSKKINLIHEKWRVAMDFLIDDAPLNATLQKQFGKPAALAIPARGEPFQPGFYAATPYVLGVEWPWNRNCADRFDLLAKDHLNSTAAFREIVSYIRNIIQR